MCYRRNNDNESNEPPSWKFDTVREQNHSPVVESIVVESVVVNHNPLNGPTEPIPYDIPVIDTNPVTESNSEPVSSEVCVDWFI